MSLEPVQARTERRQDRNQQREQPPVITGEQFRRDVLGWSKRKFYALVKSGRVRHLLAVNLSTSRRQFYVRDLALAWATETPTIRVRALRARQ